MLPVFWIKAGVFRDACERCLTREADLSGYSRVAREPFCGTAEPVPLSKTSRGLFALDLIGNEAESHGFDAGLRFELIGP